MLNDTSKVARLLVLVYGLASCFSVPQSVRLPVDLLSDKSHYWLQW